MELTFKHRQDNQQILYCVRSSKVLSVMDRNKMWGGDRKSEGVIIGREGRKGLEGDKGGSHLDI